MPSFPHPAPLRRTPFNSFSPLDVLVVDDMPAIRRMVCQMLQHLGFKGVIQEAGDGQEAWEALQERHFDVVVCDINMPRLNGLDLLRRLRATPQYETTPFLMITGEVSEDIVAASAESEVDGYLLKPFKIDALESRLRTIITHRYRPSRGESLFLRARQLLAIGQPLEALTILEQLISPPFRQQAKVLSLMGECHLALGAHEKAADSFKQSLKLNPKYLKAYQNHAALLESQGDLAGARRYLEEAQVLSPLNAERLFHLGQLCLQDGDPEPAKQYFEEAWRYGYHVPADQHLEVAETLLAAGLDQVAEKLFLEAIDATPDDVRLYNRLGVALRRQHKHQQALECYQKALKLDPHSAKVYFNLGMLYFHLGEKDKALAAFQSALQLSPDFTEARDFLTRHFFASELTNSPA